MAEHEVLTLPESVNAAQTSPPVSAMSCKFLKLSVEPEEHRVWAHHFKRLF